MSKTVKFDVENALNIYQKLEIITKDSKTIISSCEKEYKASLGYFKGKSRKTYEEESTALFEDFNKIIKDTSDMSEILQDVSKTFLDFDIKNAEILGKLYDK